MIDKVAGAGDDSLVKASDEFSVAPKVTAAPVLRVVVRTVFTPSVTALSKLCAPTVVTAPAFRSVVPEPFTASDSSAAVPPTMPPKVVTPLPVTVNERAVPSLLIVCASEISVPCRTALAVRTIASL